MAADLKPEYNLIEQQFTDLFYGKYMAEQWGIEVGYNSVPDYWACMRMQLVQWQLGMDCDNELCTESLSEDITVDSVASGTSTHIHDQPCCNDNARFQPL